MDRVETDLFQSETNSEMPLDRIRWTSQTDGKRRVETTTWYGSFRFIHLDGFHPVVFFDDLDTDPLRLSRRVPSLGHLYEIHPDSPLITLVAPNPELEREQGPAPARYRLPSAMFETIVSRISQEESH
jgi:hypothetical protein